MGRDKKLDSQLAESQQEEMAALAFYEEKFGEGVKSKLLMQPRAFVKGGILDPAAKSTTGATGGLYIPQNQRLEEARQRKIEKPKTQIPRKGSSSKGLEEFKKREERLLKMQELEMVGSRKEEIIHTPKIALKVELQSEINLDRHQNNKIYQLIIHDEEKKDLCSSVVVLGLARETSCDLLYQELLELGRITDISFFHDQIRDGNTNSLGALVAFENRKTALDLINRPQPTNILQQRAYVFLAKSRSSSSTVKRIYGPEDIMVRKAIDRTALIVARYGSAAEKKIYEIERKNPQFAFIYQKGSQYHNYYRWRCLTYLFEGDNSKNGNYSLEPFQIDHEGPVIEPPQHFDLPRFSSKFIISLKEGNEDRVLKHLKQCYLGNLPLPVKHYPAFIEILRKLNTSKQLIADGLIFCFDNAENALDIALMISDSIEESPDSSNLIGKLYLINDILHNSNLPSNLKYW